MKRFLDILISSFRGLNEQGSSRRFTAFYFTAVLITSLDLAYIYLGITSKFPADFQAILDAHLYFTSALFFATTTENILNKRNEKSTSDPGNSTL